MSERRIMGFYDYLKKIYNGIENKKRSKYLRKLVNNGLKIGRNVDIVSNFFFDPSHCFLISIGDNTTIAPNVRLIAHDASIKKILGYAKIGKIDIKENCFIGDSVIVLPNVKIGPNSIVGAGSVVTRDIPPNSIAVGNPAKVISTVDEYINKIKNMSSSTKIFGREYHIQHLDEIKRKEVLDALENRTGFII